MRENPKLKNNEWGFHCISEVQKSVALQINLNNILIYLLIFGYILELISIACYSVD
jgi:hypothetical protein